MRSDVLVIAFLHDRSHATAPAIGMACALTPDEARVRLLHMEGMLLVASRQDASTKPPRHVYCITKEGGGAEGGRVMGSVSENSSRPRRTEAPR